MLSRFSLDIMACNHYGISFEKFDRKKGNLPSYRDYSFIECNINNKITLRELCNNFKGDIWKAKNYNVASHNCQDFAA
jgi:hypothetical protein